MQAATAIVLGSVSEGIERHPGQSLFAAFTREYTAEDPVYLAEPCTGQDTVQLSETPFERQLCEELTYEFAIDAEDDDRQRARARLAKTKQACACARSGTDAPHRAGAPVGAEWR